MPEKRQEEGRDEVRGLRRSLVWAAVALALIAESALPAGGARLARPAEASVSNAPAAQQGGGYRRPRRRRRFRRVLKAPYKAIKFSGKAVGRAARWPFRRGKRRRKY